MSQFSTYFVLFSKYETDVDTSNDMQQAFEICRENGMGPKWIKENDNDIVFNKKDVIVFEKFTGTYFESLKEKKIFRILGPRCILTCLLEGIPIPQSGTTIYNMSMHGVCLSASKFNSAQKVKIQNLVNLMGGVYEKNITEDVNYLVVQMARSEKYKTATERNIKIVTKEWLEKSWQLSQTEGIVAKNIEDDYKCPIFYNLTISCTGFNSEDRGIFSRLISSNGGTFSGKLEVGKTDILICKSGAQSEKMTVAKKSRIPCVSSEWITDSVNAGYSMPEDAYLIKMASSTPNKTLAPLDANFSMMSAISSVDKNELAIPTSVGETMLQSLYDTTVEKRKGEQIPNKSPEKDIVETIDLKEVKNAGSFLDGCGIYILGYNPTQREKICKILKLSGATRYNELSDRVTQVLVGDENTPELKTIANSGFHPPVVTTQWLLECINQKQPIFEEPYLIRNKPDDVLRPSSPLSKKGLNLLRHNSSVIEEKQPEQMDVEAGPDIDESIKIYMTKKAAEEDTLEKLLQGGKLDTKMASLDKDDTTNASISGTMEEETTTNIEQIFEGKSFKLIGIDEETSENLAIVIGEMGGKVESDSFAGITDYAVVPIVCNQINHTAIEIVNQYWVMECHECEKIIDVEYYHQPMRRLSLNKPLKGCVMGITGFENSYKRSFLHTVLEDLGAICQDVFAKKSAPSKNVVGSTHLLCGSTEPVSQKLRAAKDWGKFIVSELWVMRCAETDMKLDEAPFNPCNSTPQDKVNLQSPKRDLENSVALNTEKSEKMNKSKKLPPNDAKDTSNGDILKRMHENTADLPEANQNESNQAKKLKSNNTIHSTEKPSAPENIETEKENEFGKNLSKKPQNLEESHRISTPVGNKSKEPVDKLMKRLKDEGLYDTPSPVPQFRMTPVKEVLEKARKLRPNKKGTPKLNSQRGSQDNSPGASQDTPVGKYLRGLKERMGDTETGRNDSATDISCLSETSGVVRTPDTPLGRFIEENPSPATRKRWQSYLNNIPYGSGRSHLQKNTNSPSWSEEKRKFWARTIHDGSYSEEFSEENKEAEPQKNSGQESDTQKQVNLQLDHLQNMLRRESLPSKSAILRLDGTPDKQRNSPPVRNPAYEIHTQADQVGWDEPDKPLYRKFLLSSFDEKTKEEYAKIIKSLNGELSDMAIYDPSTTHLICALPSSNEKCLCFIASGKWILSSKYLHESEKSGNFLNEEQFEISVEDIPESKKTESEKEKKQRSLCDAARWWRKKRETTGKCAFFGIKAIVMTANSSPICRLIEAGGGTVVNIEPPFTHNIDITHCFLDVKTKFNIEDYIPLAQQGIPCLNIFYLHNYLLKRGETDMKNFYIDTLRTYYDS